MTYHEIVGINSLAGEYSHTKPVCYYDSCDGCKKNNLLKCLCLT